MNVNSKVIYGLWNTNKFVKFNKTTVSILCIQMGRGSYVSPESTRGLRQEILDHFHYGK